MKTYSFTAHDRAPDQQSMVERRTSGQQDKLRAYGFSGPYFQPDAVEVKELARDIHNHLIEQSIIAPDLEPPLQNNIREVLVKFLASQFQINIERSS